VIEFKFRCKSLITILIGNPLNASPLSFPILECFHIVGFAILVGPVAIVDFRLLGWGVLRESPAELAYAFDLKMSFLVLEIIFNFTIHRTTVLSETTTGVIGGARSRLVACTSLGLWLW
jgi:hypothetical protein